MGCGGFAVRATLEWIEVGGRRIDAANSYQNQQAVGQAMALSQIPRDQFFLLSKTGPSNPLGYNDTLKQFAAVKAEMGTTYVDALLIHWPFDSSSQGNVSNPDVVSTDPVCNKTRTETFNEKTCRLGEWVGVRARVCCVHSGPLAPLALHLTCNTCLLHANCCRLPPQTRGARWWRSSTRGAPARSGCPTTT